MRPRPRPSEVAAWQAGGADATDSCVRVGLGIRPEGWWRFETDRPDLADGSGLDAYAHLEGNPQADRACERFRYLVAHDLLTRSELDAIASGDGPAYEWRRTLQGEP